MGAILAGSATTIESLEDQSQPGDSAVQLIDSACPRSQEKFLCQQSALQRAGAPKLKGLFLSFFFFLLRCQKSEEIPNFFQLIDSIYVFSSTGLLMKPIAIVSCVEDGVLEQYFEKK